MTILVDMDGPLADFEKGFLKQWQIVFPNERFIPLEERTTFRIQDQYGLKLHDKIRAVYSAPGFYRQLPIIPGAKEALTQLTEKGHNLRICTSPLTEYKNCVLEKYQWVEENLGSSFIKRIIVTKDKTLIRGDLLIDDNPTITGVYSPVWEHILFDKPYNRAPKHDKRLDDWFNWETVLLNG
jgi:5'-nucleotidase